MIVTHEDTNITHVAMGGHAAIECGITGDAHFMHMLSASLYKDQKLAMVREVACNAWDAHIMVDKTSPIEITIDNEELVIKDFGPGIAHDKIGPIYGVYGASTKKNDGKQTGGFGLGCKSPWSYTDTFEVISCHEGKMAIYQMTKSASELGGKPSIKPMAVDIPTAESGITVKIRLKSAHDANEILGKLKEVLYYGGIPCMLNGKLAKCIDYDQMQTNWIVTNHLQNNNNKTMLQVRYGNVVYPITDHPTYTDLLKTIHKFTKTLPENTHRYVMIFQAEPDSLAPTPSREELSMIDMTVETLRGLLQSFVTELKQDGETLTIKRALERIREAGNVDVTKVLTYEASIPKRTTNALITDHGYYDRFLSRPVTKLEDLTDLSLDTTYPGTYMPGFRAQDMAERWKVIKAKLGTQWNQRLARSFEKAYFTDTTGGESKLQKQWLTREYTGWVVGKMLNHTKEMKKENLFILGQGSRISYYSSRRGNRELAHEVVSVDGFCPTLFHHMIPFLKGRVILTHSRTTIDARMYQHKDFRHSCRGIGSLIYVVPRSARMVEEAKLLFAKLGLTVIDMLEIHDWEADCFKPKKRAPVDPNKPKVKKVKKTGHLCFGAALRNGNNYDPYAFARDNPEAARIEKPEFWLRLEPKTRSGYDHSVGRFALSESRQICKLWGHLGAIAVKEAEQEALVAAGIPHVDDWVIDRVFKEMKTNKRVREMLANKTSSLSTNQLGNMAVISMLRNDKELAKLYSLDFEPLDRDDTLFSLYRSLARHFKDPYGHFRHIPGNATRVVEWTKLAMVLDAVEPAPHLVSLAQKLGGNLAVELLNTGTACNILNANPADAAKQQQVRQFIINAIG